MQKDPAIQQTNPSTPSAETTPLITPPRPGLLESNGYDLLLKSFSREMKDSPTPGAWLNVGAIVLKQIEKNESAHQAAKNSPQLKQKLVETGAILPEKQLELMNIKADQVVTLPKVLEIEMRRKGFFYLQALTHPAILQARILMQDAGYSPLPGKTIPLFEKLIQDDRACTYEDFGLQPRQPKPQDGVQESSSRILAQGCFSWISRNHVGFPTTSNSMPSTNSAEALATLALVGTFACVPTDGHLVSLESRLSLVRSTRKAIEEHVVVKYHKHASHMLSNGKTLQEELKSRTSFLVATVKQNPQTVLKEASALYAEGIRTFRLYDAGSTNQLAQAVSILKKNMPSDITILAGQVTGVEQARDLAARGADGLIVGIGEGGICTTPVVGSLAPNNILVAYQLCKAGLGTPIICDGGVGRAAGVIFAMGASANMASRRVIGGTLEHSPTLNWIKRNGHYEKPYAGEASGVVKILGGNTTMVGDPYNIEGITSFVQMNEEYPTTSAIYSGILAGITKMVRFARAHSVDDLMRRPIEDSIKLLSDGARAAAGAHHVQSAIPLVLYGKPIKEFISR